MGVSAGRVLLIPKGDWNAETTYTGLDWVRHNGAAWVCKNTCTNVEPTDENSDNWQIIARDGTEITVDTEISDQSENPVQNKVIKKYVDSKQVEVPIAGKGTAGIVKPADGLIITEDGTLKVSLDGTTLTMDQVDNVIKLADTLKEKINGALPSANIVNNLTTTETGFALDARQANPNVSGSLGAQIQHVRNSAVKASVIDIFDKNSLHVTASDNTTVSATATWMGDQLYVSVPSVPAGKTTISIYLSMPANSYVILNAYGTQGQNIVYKSGCIFSNNTDNSKNKYFPFVISENRTGGHSILIKVLVISGI